MTDVRTPEAGQGAPGAGQSAAGAGQGAAGAGQGGVRVSGIRVLLCGTGEDRLD